MTIYPSAAPPPYIAREIAGADPRNHTGHGKGHTHDQHKARRRSRKCGDRTASPLFPALSCGDAPLCFRKAFFMAPHL